MKALFLYKIYRKFRANGPQISKNSRKEIHSDTTFTDAMLRL
jgi:hypothetical protein